MKNNDPDVYKDINKPNGKTDAIRHMFINATASRYGMSDFVKKFSTQRELSSGYVSYDQKSWREFNEDDFKKFNGYSFDLFVSCNPKIPKSYLEKQQHEKMLDRMIVNKMDIHNNAIGIKLGTNTPCDSLESLYKKVKSEYLKGNAIEVVSAAKRCFDVRSNYNRESVVNEDKDCLNYYSNPEPKYGRIIYPKQENDEFKCPKDK